jgi:hypothetical protein
MILLSRAVATANDPNGNGLRANDDQAIPVAHVAHNREPSAA